MAVDIATSCSLNDDYNSSLIDELIQATQQMGVALTAADVENATKVQDGQ